MTEAEVVDLLRPRSGRARRAIATDGEPMEAQVIVQAAASASADDEYAYYVARVGIPLSADEGRYFLYSNEIHRVRGCGDW